RLITGADVLIPDPPLLSSHRPPVQRRRNADPNRQYVRSAPCGLNQRSWLASRNVPYETLRAHLTGYFISGGVRSSVAPTPNAAPIAWSSESARPASHASDHAGGSIRARAASRWRA